ALRASRSSRARLAASAAAAAASADLRAVHCPALAAKAPAILSVSLVPADTSASSPWAGSGCWAWARLAARRSSCRWRISSGFMGGGLRESGGAGRAGPGGSAHVGHGRHDDPVLARTAGDLDLVALQRVPAGQLGQGDGAGGGALEADGQLVLGARGQAG